MRPDAIVTTVAAVFLVAVGVVAGYFAVAGRLAAASYTPGVVSGGVVVAIGVIGFWMNRRAWL